MMFRTILGWDRRIHLKECLFNCCLLVFPVSLLSGYSCNNPFQPNISDVVNPLGKHVLDNTSYDSCKSECAVVNRKNEQVCYGFDYNSASRNCSISTTKDYMLTPQANAVHSKVKVICYSEG